MDKKNLILGVGCIGLAFLVMFINGRRQAEQIEQQQAVAAESEALTENAGKDGASPLVGGAAESGRLVTVVEEETETSSNGSEVSAFGEVTVAESGQLARPVVVPPVEPAVSGLEQAEKFVLENDFIRVTFTSRGGAIESVALLKYPDEKGSTEPFVFNEVANTPALAISLPDRNGIPEPYEANFQVVERKNHSILFSYTTGGLEVRRGYQLCPPSSDAIDPYVIVHETAFINRSEQALDLGRFFLNAGTSLPTRGDIWGEYLSFGYLSDGDAEFRSIRSFRGRSGILGVGRKDPTEFVLEGPMAVSWVSIKNQFFAAVLTPNRPGNGIFAKTVKLQGEFDDSNMSQALTGDIEFAIGRIDPGQREVLGVQYYVGPKEFTRLQALGNADGYAGNQDEVMQFGFFGFISKILLVLMIGIHSLIGKLSPDWGWGWTIIVVTVLIKACLWPLTAAQVRSARRMSKIQGPLKEIREKYKDNPQKVQQETMKLFRENKVNPLAGCLPLLVQIPIFIGLFFMLRTSSELRFAGFLWIPDLSLPDTVAVIGGFPLNILPLLMAVSMFFQMRMTPMPTADNVQRKVFQMMPFIFLIFCYNFPSGLVLYWTTQNLLTMLQTWLTNRNREEVVAAAVESAKAKPVAKSGSGKGSRKNSPKQKR